MTGAPKYPSTLYLPFQSGDHRDHRWCPEPERFVGRRVVITEKLDGGNTCLNQGKVYSRSSGQPATESWFDYVKGKHALRTYEMPSDVYIYGENMYAIHSIEYGVLPDVYFVFALRQEDHFLAWDELVTFTEVFGFSHVPLLFDGEFKSIKEIESWMMERLGKPSVYGPTREGFVIRNADSFHADDFGINVAKLVRPNHVQTDVHWTKTWKPAEFEKGS